MRYIKWLLLLFIVSGYFLITPRVIASVCSPWTCAGTWSCPNCIVTSCNWNAAGYCENGGTAASSTYTCSNTSSSCETQVPGVKVCNGYSTASECAAHSLQSNRSENRGCCSGILESVPTDTPAPTNTPVPTSAPGCTPGSCDTSGCDNVCEGGSCGWNGCGTCSTGTKVCTTTSTPTPTSSVPGGTVQGIKRVVPGGAIAPAIGATVSVSGAGSSANDPYSIAASAGNHTASITDPGGGYGIGYNYCSTALQPQCGESFDPRGYHLAYPLNGSSTNVDVPSGGLIDLWWYFFVPPTGSITGPNVACVGQPTTYQVTGAAPDYQRSTLTYSLRSSQTWPTTAPYSGGPGPASITFPAAGDYWVATNSFGTHGGKCTGNPFGIPAGWADCNRFGLTDAIAVTVSNVATPPPFLTATTNTGGVQLTWSGGSYNIQRRLTASAIWTTLPGGVKASGYIDPGSCGTSYTYRLIESNLCGSATGNEPAAVAGCVPNWFQTKGGNVGAVQAIDDSDVVAGEYMCTRSVSANSLTGGNVYAGSGINVPNGQITDGGSYYAAQAWSTNLATDYNYAKLKEDAEAYVGGPLTSNNVVTMGGFAGLICSTRSGGDGFQYCLVTSTSQPTLNITGITLGNTKYVIFAEKDVTISGNLNNLGSSSNFVLIVNGDITVSPAVGSPTSPAAAPQLEGLYFANGQFVASSAITTQYLWVRGSVVAMGGVSLSNRKPLANVEPASFFEFNPRLLITYPQGVAHTQRVLQEANP